MAANKAIFGMVSILLALSSSAYAKFDGNGSITKADLMNHIKKVGLDPAEDTTKGFVYYRCGIDPKDLMNDEKRDQSGIDAGSNPERYYAITKMKASLAHSDKETIGFKVTIQKTSKSVRDKDGFSQIQYRGTVTFDDLMTRTHFSSMPSLAGSEGEILGDKKSFEGGDRPVFTGEGELLDILPEYQEKSTCMPVGLGQIDTSELVLQPLK